MRGGTPPCAVAAAMPAAAADAPAPPVVVVAATSCTAQAGRPTRPGADLGSIWAQVRINRGPIRWDALPGCGGGARGGYRPCAAAALCAPASAGAATATWSRKLAAAALRARATASIGLLCPCRGVNSGMVLLSADRGVARREVGSKGWPKTASRQSWRCPGAPLVLHF